MRGCSFEFLISGNFLNPPVAKKIRNVKRTAPIPAEKIFAKFVEVCGLVQFEFGGVFPNRAEQNFLARVLADNAAVCAQLVNRHVIQSFPVAKHVKRHCYSLSL